MALAVLLVICACSSFALHAQAAEVNTNINIMPANQEDNGGIAYAAASGQTSGLPFTVLPPSGTKTLYTTNRSGGYNFVPGQISGTTITVNGVLTFSTSSAEGRGGVCYYSGGSYVSVIANNALSGNGIIASGYRANLDPDRTYYGFVKPLTSGASISGGYVTIGVR